MNTTTFLTVAVLATASAASARADGAADLKAQCGACHALEKPADPSVERLWTRKGPDLWYAGAKFRREWLVKWLQTPTTIRPGGVLWFTHAKPGEPRDTLETAALPAHPKLQPKAAESLADALMGLKGSGEVTPGAFKPEGANLTMGKMAFGKLRGCAACHQDKPGQGGLSGPQLYDAGDRLQPDYVQAYIKDPQVFDRFVWMPRLGLSDQDLQRLTAYVTSLRGGQ
ncbi:MAG: c-type cytochrome [Phenylobacterium sp.]|uniref:c-type cytochrome n=1 Tax=Phenylobacterium sp. TaxID=1871053 RepID=UPI0025EBC1F5|nr:c-type cytochrome [Phenylobacterium sp.]MBI1200343.1 c-type cytochrome [Phenylobacterium sp.]